MQLAALKQEGTRLAALRHHLVSLTCGSRAISEQVRGP